MKKELINAFHMMFVVLVCISCNNSEGLFADKNLKEGSTLSKKYCASCHQFPEPWQLDKNTWAQHVLPKMAPYVGFEFYAGSYMASDSGIGLGLQQWNNIWKYYVSQAPDSVLQADQKIADIAPETPLFIEIGVKANIQSPSTTLVIVDPVKHRILFGDGMIGQVYIVSKDTLITDSLEAGIGVANLRIKDSTFWILSMGIMHPSDEKAGSLIIHSEERSAAIKLFDSLQRPVFGAYADLNNDQQEDIVLSEFGDRFGSFSWMENRGNNRYQKHMLRALPGSVKSIVYDFDRDGLKDIIVLMAQGDEGVFIYYNKGDGQFREQRVLTFPPSYGSNYFELADFNNDGYADIITSNGDNGDYPPVLKPYHGIRLFLNDGKNQFVEKLFLPVNGIGKVIARDFDMDGDLDLASIAYFADFKNRPSEAFIYWKNAGNFQFKPSTIQGVLEGRWITMDAGDYDGDGDADIVLGNADFRIGDIPEHLKKKWDNYSPSLLILKNQLRN